MALKADGTGETEQSIIRDIELENGSGRWWGSVATVDQIEERPEHYAATGECAGGAYFWSAGLVGVRDSGDDTLKEAVNDLIDSGEYMNALVRIDD